MKLPEWVVLHIPHDSTVIPDSVRDQFVLSDDELQLELQRMTDHHTLALFAGTNAGAQVVVAPVSRLVVDVERFANDADEPMAARGMGAIYNLTSQYTPLRRALSASEREELMHTYYYPHHARLEQAVTNALEQHGRCLVIDCHSFPDQALPYEMAVQTYERPDICIGSDDFHTSEELKAAFVSEFEREGWSVKLNDPFAGALVPISRYRRDLRVSAVMIEVNRRLYMQVGTPGAPAAFGAIADRVRQVCANAINTALASSSGIRIPEEQGGLIDSHVVPGLPVTDTSSLGSGGGCSRQEHITTSAMA